ncbi:DUF4145 domain-containing protein [Streptomyces sp. NPDC056254]|uniref:DUF4145 domain-containing protein n=1 Tax=Streptomyces sp. NPDC056254 TaxID=3345763 RepID=UPI0035DB75EA
MNARTRVGRSFPLVCPLCEKPTLAKVTSEAQGDDPELGPPYLLELLQCGTCANPFLAVEEDYGEGWDGSPHVLWPPQNRRLSAQIPADIRREHEEARQCFSSKLYTATVVMVRRTLEGVCIEQGVASTGRPKPLIQLLQKMKEDGKIEGRLLEWAQELRVLGNQGAHFTGTAVSREDASDGLALAEALLDYLYVFSAQFAAFKARRTSPEDASPAKQPTKEGDK